MISRGEDVRKKFINITLIPSTPIIFGYILKSSLEGEGWAFSVGDLEDIIGLHV